MEEREGFTITRPNRDRAASKATRAVVILLLLVSAVLVVVVMAGGWDVLQGAKLVQVAFVLLYLLIAFLVFRWSRGALPVGAALAILLLIFAAVAGPAWFDRDKEGYTSPALDDNLLGLLTLLLIPIQALLIAFAMRGFNQAWNVEEEHPIDAHGRPPHSPGRPGAPAPI